MVPQLHWIDCGDGVHCATATVPLDYDEPRGRTIQIALAKRPATDPARRIGTMFVNPGGPGGTGVGYVRGDLRTSFTDALVTQQPGRGRFPSIRAMVEVDVRDWLQIVGITLGDELIERILAMAETELKPFLTPDDGGVGFDSPAVIARARR